MILYTAIKTIAFDWLDAIVLHISKTADLYHYLVMKLQPDAKKISNAWSSLFFRVAKLFAQHLFAPHHHTNICKVTKRIWTLLRCFTSLSLISSRLSTRDVMPCAVKQIEHILRYYSMPSKCSRKLMKLKRCSKVTSKNSDFRELIGKFFVVSSR